MTSSCETDSDDKTNVKSRLPDQERNALHSQGAEKGPKGLLSAGNLIMTLLLCCIVMYFTYFIVLCVTQVTNTAINRNR